jgi:Rps23 Pro-64 3,4-dihydroxylase Tpa1-like proline 4-hydroxylase
MQIAQVEQGVRGTHGLLDQLSFSESTVSLSSKFHSAAPFRHVVFDNLFKPTTLDALVGEIKQIKGSGWVRYNSDREEKYTQQSALGLGKAAFQLVSLLHSANFLYFLSEITGIWNLLPDPYLHGGGFSIIPPHGKFDVHVDRNADASNGLVRRLALITYLNHDWHPEYGGNLELWNKDATAKVATVVPAFNRVILMEISETGYHGISPVVEPHGRSRLAFMLYFNTAGDILGKDSGVHSTVFAPLSYRPKPRIRTLVRNVMPPIVFDLLRRRTI